MKNSNFEDIFRESGAHDRGFDFQESSWEDLEKRLEKPKKRRRFLWIWFLVPAILGSIFFGNMLLKSDSDLASVPTISQNTKESFPQIYKTNPTADESNSLEKSNPIHLPKSENNNVITKPENVKIEKNVLKKTSTNSPLIANTNPDNNTISKKLNNRSDNFTLVEDNNLQPKNTKQHHQSTLSKEEPISSEKTKVTFQTQKEIVQSKDQKSSTPLNSTTPLMSLEGSGMITSDNKIDLKIIPKERKWEIGLSVGSNITTYISSIYLLQVDSNLVPPNNRGAPLFTTNNTGVQEELYIDSYVGNEFKKNFQPIMRLSVGKELRKSLLLRGGIILIRDATPRKGIKKLLEENQSPYAGSFEYNTNYLLLDVGLHFHLRPNIKRLRPYLGVAPMFKFLHTQKSGLKIYSSENKKIDESVNINERNWNFNFVGFNAEGGLKYRIIPRIEMGLQAYVFGAPFQNRRFSLSEDNFTKIQFAASINFKM